MYEDRIDPKIWRQHAWLNRLQSLLLLAVMAAFLALLGWILWGIEGIAVLLTAGAIGVLFSPTIVPRLMMRFYGAIQVGAQQAPELWTAVSRLAERAGLEKDPDLYYVPSRIVNSFAVGSRKRSAVAVSDGLLRQLDLRELVGVLAHEISHIRSNDLWVLALADMFSRMTSALSLIGQILLVLNLPLILVSNVAINWFAILLLIFAPNLSALAQLALARTREFDADLNAVRLTGDPDGLALALAKIESGQGGWWERILMPERRLPQPSLLRTHPDTGERINRLMALKREAIGGNRPAFGRDFFEARRAFGEPVLRPPRRHFTGLWH
ncbi:MAG: zinc metalloprotease HtpX [Gammaproteobacteria bacterium]